MQPPEHPAASNVGSSGPRCNETPESLAATASPQSLIERAEWEKHRWPADASDLITELVDELQAAFRVVEAALAVDGHSQGFPPLVPPSLIAPFRESLRPFRTGEEQ